MLKARQKETGAIVAIKKFKVRPSSCRSPPALFFTCQRDIGDRPAWHGAAARRRAEPWRSHCGRSVAQESDEDEQVRKTALREVRILKVRSLHIRPTSRPSQSERNSNGALRFAHRSQQLKHDNIVSLIEVFRRKGKLYLVFEFMESTILEELEKHPNGLDATECKKCIYQLLRSIGYCHSNNIIHRDIKPENLLLSKHGILKLCDFGFARPLGGPGARYTDYVATRWYRSPELLVGDTQYGRGVDVWAIGCMFAEIHTGLPLFPGESDIDQLFHILRCQGNLTEHLSQCLQKNPLFEGVEIPHIREPETLKRRFPRFEPDTVQFMQVSNVLTSNLPLP